MDNTDPDVISPQVPSGNQLRPILYTSNFKIKTLRIFSVLPAQPEDGFSWSTLNALKLCRDENVMV